MTDAAPIPSSVAPNEGTSIGDNKNIRNREDHRLPADFNLLQLEPYIIRLILSRLELPDLLKCRLLHRDMETHCRRQLDTKYVQESYAFLGAYTCPARTEWDEWGTERWKPTFESETDMVTWRGTVTAGNLPVDGLFLYLGRANMWPKPVFVDLPRNCLHCRMKTAFLVTAYINNDDGMGNRETHRYSFACLTPRRVGKHFNGPAPRDTLRNVLEWKVPHYAERRGANVDGRYCQILYFGGGLWELALSLWSFLAILQQEVLDVPKWHTL